MRVELRQHNKDNWSIYIIYRTSAYWDPGVETTSYNLIKIESKKQGKDFCELMEWDYLVYE
jgi:hypothetical protein